MTKDKLEIENARLRQMLQIALSTTKIKARKTYEEIMRRINEKS